MKQLNKTFSVLTFAFLCISLMTACGAKENSANNTFSGGTGNKSSENKSAGQSDSDAGKDNAAIKALQGTDEKMKQQTIEEVLSQPNDYNPLVLCVLSQKLFEQEKRDDASFWFYTCQLRARIDSKISTDLSTETAVAELNQTFGPNVNKYAFQDLDNLEKIVNKTVEFVRANEENYDRSWIYKSGMDALRARMQKKAAEDPLKPQAEWAEIKKNTIENYYKDFMEAKKKISEVKKQKYSAN